MNKRNTKIAIGIVLLLVVSFFWGEFNPFSKKGLPEVDKNVVIQRTDDEESAEVEGFDLAKLEDDEIIKEDEIDELEDEEIIEEKEAEKKEEDLKKEKEDLKDKNDSKPQNEEIKKEKEDIKIAKETRVAKPSATTMGTKQETVSLKVSAKTLLNNKDKLDKNKHDLVPKNGIIYNNASVAINKGDTVFDVLIREMKDSGIHLESSMTPIYKTNYVEGINNLYEFDAGELSGWMYRVNGEFPGYGASEVEVKPGDVIEWLYTCDLGKDIGGKNSTGGRR